MKTLWIIAGTTLIAALIAAGIGHHGGGVDYFSAEQTAKNIARAAGWAAVSNVCLIFSGVAAIGALIVRGVLNGVRVV